MHVLSDNSCMHWNEGRDVRGRTLPWSYISLSLSLFSLASEPNKLGGGKTDMSDIHPSSVLAYPALLLGPLAATRDSITEQLFPALIGAAEEQEESRGTKPISALRPPPPSLAEFSG